MPLFPPQEYIHLRLTRIGEQAGRRKRPGRGRLPPRNPSEQGAKLSAEVRGILNARIRRQEPDGIDPALVLRVRLEPDTHIDEDEWRRSQFTIIGSEPDNVVLLFANDEAMTAFRDRIDLYSLGAPDEKQKNPRYNWLAGILDIAEWGPSDRQGSTLRNLDLSAPAIVDVELWYPGTRDRCQDLVNNLRTRSTQFGGELLDAYIGKSLLLGRVRLDSDALNGLLQWDWVYKVEAPPKPDFSMATVRHLALSNFPPVQPPPEDAQSIGILDSGLAAGHPFVAAAVGETRAVPVSLGTSADVHGHGTMVAGLALYGDVQANITDRNFQPQFQLFSARVTNEANEFDDFRVVENQTREAIEYFHREHRCRVFNLSVGDRHQPYRGGRVSAWAATLDELARELDIVITVSAGNYRLTPDDAAPREAPLTQYPDYLFTSDARILSPAEAVNVLTIGSLAREGAPQLSDRHPADPAYQTPARHLEPSPFTRSGPGPEGACKPDLCEIGGSWSIDLRTGARDFRDSGLGCVSFSRDFTRSGLFAFGSGTSYAAPRVAHAAAGILQRYPQASANLVRSLLASSATVPAEANARVRNDELITQLCGYGRPDGRLAGVSLDERVTLAAEEEIGADAFHVFEVPLPDEFMHTPGDRRIVVTLAFDPPVRNTRLDYIGTKMQFRLVRGVSIEAVYDAFRAKERGAELPPKLASSAICPTSPGIQEYSRGTLQRAVHSIKRDPKHAEPYYVVVECQNRWAADSEYPQRYALVVTLEHSQAGVRLYEAVSLRARAMAQERIRVQA